MPDLNREQPPQKPAEGGDEAVDGVIDAAAGMVPEGAFKSILKQAGWGGLVLGVLMGNIPVSIAIGKAAAGKGSLNADAIEIYFSVFVLVTPWVVLFAVFTYCVTSGNYPRMSGPAYLITSALLVVLAGYISVSLGGVVPVEVAAGPESGGPAGAAQYTATSLSSYVKLYGMLPPLAGAIEGGLFGYWIALLSKADD